MEMETAPAPSSSLTAKILWPLAGIACFGIVICLIAVMIVLALIPVYREKRNLQPSPNSLKDNSFVAQWRTGLTNDFGIPGRVTNLADVARSMNIADLVYVTDGGVQPATGRRKRAIQSLRIQQTIQNRVPNLPILFQILSGSSTRLVFFTLNSPAFFTAVPSGFTDVGNTTDFRAVQSGPFNSRATWSTNIVPYGTFTARIPAGITVTIDRAVLELNMTFCEINGTLAVGAGNTIFTFQYPTNIIVRAGGSFLDQTSGRVIRLQPMSLITLHPNAISNSVGTTLQTVGSTMRTLNATISTQLPQSGPFTCGILQSRQLSDRLVTFIAIQSGNFTTGSVYLGGFAPTADLCLLVGGCGIGVIGGVVLSTADLNGKLDIQINTILVESSATFSLGTPNQPDGFRFRYPVLIDVYGVVAVASSGGDIRIPTSSALNFFNGSRINSIEASTFIQITDFTNGLDIGSHNALNTSFTGPIFYTIGNDGTFSSNTNGPQNPQSVTTTNFVALRSGSFDSGATWSTGIVPRGNCSVHIPAGITVTIERAILELNMTFCEINGTLVLGTSSTATFTFQYATNIMVRSGGSLQDQTTSRLILLQPMSLITLYPNATSNLPVTTLQTVGSRKRTISGNRNTQLPQSGPFTCGILKDRQLSDQLVTFFAIQSGSFTTGSVYLGGFAPSNGLCALVGGCGIGVIGGVVLSTADLNGKLDMDIDNIFVESNATLSLGTPSQPDGFRFLNSVRIDVFGLVSLVSNNGTIRMPTYSALNFFNGSRINSTAPSPSIQVYNPSTQANIYPPQPLNSSFTGSIFYTIRNDGTFYVNPDSPVDPQQATTASPMSTHVPG